MATPTQPLRDEHKELWPHVERLRTTADAVGEAPVELIQRGVDEVYDFLAHDLVPHARAEEAALYPVVQQVMGAPQATATMSRDHVEVGRLVEELAGLRAKLATGALGPEQARALRRVLYGLYALLAVHFAKEEEVYLPLLDQGLSAAEAAAMFERMEAAAQTAKEEVRKH